MDSNRPAPRTREQRLHSDSRDASARPRPRVRDLNIPEISIGGSAARRSSATAFRPSPSASQRSEASRASLSSGQHRPSARKPSDGSRGVAPRPVYGGSASSARHVDAARSAGSGSTYRAFAGGRRAQGAVQPRLSSVRIGDMDRRSAGSHEQNRRQDVPARSWASRLAIAIGVVLSVLLAAAVAFFVLARSGMFEIRQVSVSGVEHLTSTDVSALVSIPQGTSLLDVDVDGIERSLLRDAWIQDVSIDRSFPDTLNISVTERTIAAIVEIPTGVNQQVRQWAISSDGIWLMPVPDRDSEAGKATSDQVYEDAAAALHIVDVPYGAQPEIGAPCTDPNIENALAVVSGMTTELADQVTVVSATDPESATLTLESGLEIAFGSATDIREKERVCLQLMSEYEGQIAYINVRVVERPTWRAL